ncbi:MAG: radical SAM protein, partial [Oscillospiraceae bacterium]|nr:radical SAM protein [Oscillospiraceae bacterium]
MDLHRCELCPRRCGADRYKRTGYCGEGAVMRIARIAPHMWEEPCLSGTKGAGTVFFVGCTL